MTRDKKINWMERLFYILIIILITTELTTGDLYYIQSIAVILTILCLIKYITLHYNDPIQVKSREWDRKFKEFSEMYMKDRYHEYLEKGKHYKKIR